jgi:hypothetical protein
MDAEIPRWRNRLDAVASANAYKALAADEEQRPRSTVLAFDESGCAAEQYRARTHARISSRASACGSL